MLLKGTEIHYLTILFILLEIGLLFYQLIHYLSRPHEKNRLYYLILLALLILYNVAGGLFPDTNLNVSMQIQYGLAYGSGILLGCYFPFYFYKAFRLHSLKFHALYGTFIFLIFPFFLFLALTYQTRLELEKAINYGLIIPGIYAIILLCLILKAIRQKFKYDNSNRFQMIAVYIAIVPWAIMPVFSYFRITQVVEVLIMNGGFIIITILFIQQSIKQSRIDYTLLTSLNNRPDYTINELEIDKINQSISSLKELIPNIHSKFQHNCNSFSLTNREIEITRLIIEGKSAGMIGELLFISSRTVDKHIQNVYKKVNVSNKLELLNKLKN